MSSASWRASRDGPPSGGLMQEKDYPYTGKDHGTCKLDKSKIVASVSNFSLISVDEDQIAANLVKNGPFAVGINAVYMQTYMKGVSCPYICGKHLDHGVLLVGYGSAGYAPIRFKEKPYWIIKNSWGANWGEDGYYKILQGSEFMWRRLHVLWCCCRSQGPSVDGQVIIVLKLL